MQDSLPQSHSFIRFRFDGSRVPPHTWAFLGEASSIIDQITSTPLKPSTSTELHRVFLAKGVHGTAAIEGNTLSEGEVAKRIDGTLVLPESQDYLGKEIDNIVQAYNRIVVKIRHGAGQEIEPDDLKQFNRLVLEGLDLAPEVVPGEYREHAVTVGDYLSPPPEFTNGLVESLCIWLCDPVWHEATGPRFVRPILKAIFAHLYIAWIHPFGDGNGRTARLVEFDILAKAGVPTASAHVLSDYYNRSRQAYYRALSLARRDPTYFVEYAAKGLAEGLRQQVQVIRPQQMGVAWINYVHEVFEKERPTEASRRRRNVAIALAAKRETVPVSEVAKLSPELSAAYANRTSKTVSRDLNNLEALGLIVRKSDGVRAKTGRMLAFLPLVNPDADPG